MLGSVTWYENAANDNMLNVSLGMAQLFCQADLFDSSYFIVSVILKGKTMKLFRDVER